MMYLAVPRSHVSPKMTPQSELESTGNFLAHPFAELLAEIAQSRLNGSLRVSYSEKKCVIYFKHGTVVFAVSNARTSRLFDILLRQKRMTKEEIVAIPDFANDMEFAAHLSDNNILTKADCDKLFADQIKAILVDVLSWPDAVWTFSSLARIRDGLAFEINVPELLIEFARCLPVKTVLDRFRSTEESFARSENSEIGLALSPTDAFILSRSNEGELSAGAIVSVAGMSAGDVFHSIYTLWLGGLLIRKDWQAAFSAEMVGAMHHAKLELKTEAKLARSTAHVHNATVAEPEAETQEPEIEAELTVDEYLARIEKAETHYDILGVDTKAEISELKNAYFTLAKMFHPDRFHSAGGDLPKRMQHAFTELAQAHETLKNPETRELYDYRMRKELAEREKYQAAGTDGKEEKREEQAAQNFDAGYALLSQGDHDGALPLFARAVHFVPKNAKYHAYYGKALSFNDKTRHKAESELQAAVKLDPKEAAYRLMLVEFFIQYNLLKRAEGDLNRLLDIAPNNQEAQRLLAELQAKV